MCCCFTRISCSIQLWCLKNHDSCILFPLTWLLLRFFYYIDLALYIMNPRKFLVSRAELLGSKNFASLGRMILGDHAAVSKAINSPQLRDSYLGRALLLPGKFPDSFPLFLSDAIEEEKVKHKAIHDYIWINVIPAANRFIEANSDVFQGYVTDLVASGKAGEPRDEGVLKKSVIRYIFHALLGRIDDRFVDIIDQLFFNAWGGYVTGGLKLPFCCFCWNSCSAGKRQSLIDDAVKYVSESPIMEKYEPFENISKEECSEIIFAVSGIAGCLGTTQLLTNLFADIPVTEVTDMNTGDVLLYVLEAARIRAPVNNVNFRIAEESVTVIAHRGKEVTLPKGVLCAASIGLASHDADVFPDPKKFNPKRENLKDALVNFNHVGYASTGSGTRQCPGRNVSIKFASDVLIAYQESMAASA